MTEESNPNTVPESFAKKLLALSDQVVAQEKTISSLRQLVSENEKQKAIMANNSRPFKGLRLLGLFIGLVLSIVIGASGFILWLARLAPPDACLMLFPGVALFGILLVCIHGLAEDEK